MYKLCSLWNQEIANGGEEVRVHKILAIGDGDTYPKFGNIGERMCVMSKNIGSGS
jgi:hypothetical protein